MGSGQVGVMPTGILGIEIKAANGKGNVTTGLRQNWSPAELVSAQLVSSRTGLQN